MSELDRTVEFGSEKDNTADIIKTVYDALLEKGYDAVNQLVGYLVSGDPSYITSHNDARNLIQSIDQDVLMEFFVRKYFGKFEK